MRRAPALFIFRARGYNESKNRTSGEELDVSGFIVIAWAVLLVLLLYLWADVREIAGIVKESKREILRGSLNARAAESFPNFQEEEKKERQKNREKQGAEEKKPQGVPLNASEQQVLDEVLTEFLG